jgi:phosphoribosylformylglycinamidine synthase
MKLRVFVTLKPGVLDPQGRAVMNSLHALGFDGVEQVRQGKYLEIEMDGELSGEALDRQADEMCRKLLANTVIENYRYELAS